MNIIYKILKISFFVFLDISGILLGVFLTILGMGMLYVWRLPGAISWIVLILGICAFLLHIGHYFNLRYMRWLFGDKYFIQKK